MAYDQGKHIREFDNAKGPTVAFVRIGGKRYAVSLHHVSRETMNKPYRPERRAKRERSRVARCRRMRLRKLRGWR